MYLSIHIVLNKNKTTDDLKFELICALCTSLNDS